MEEREREQVNEIKEYGGNEERRRNSRELRFLRLKDFNFLLSAWFTTWTNTVNNVDY